ncbi:MAG: tyrosine-type recombinase/integrase [Bdellovibrionales bacterium]|nr:tyrosine-type recombinase/integrase [Bdellovibrionales bacterium]
MFSESAKSDIANSALLSIIESYVNYYATGKSHTARAKRLDLKAFVEFLQAYRGYGKPQSLKVRDWDFSAVQRFVDELLTRGEAPSTVARRLATIKHMGRALAEKIPGFVNPAREIKAPRLKLDCPKALTKTEISQARERARDRLGEKPSFIRLRNHTIFELLLDTGLRAEEIRLLKLSQIDNGFEWIKSVRTKGRRFRNVYITSKMRPYLKRYLQERDKLLKKRFPRATKAMTLKLPLFISLYAAKLAQPETFLMGPKTIWRAIDELSNETHIHPHLLRHSFAIDLLDNSKDVRLVSQALGHSDVRITMRYTERHDKDIAVALERSRKKR